MVYLGADHGGFELKEKVKGWLTELGFEYQDLGATALDNTDDYPPFAKAVADQVITNPLNRGILICRSGGGMVIAANKIKGTRAIYVFDEKSARHAREHNDANIACLAAGWIQESDARKAIEAFLTSMFSEEDRHSRRINQIKAMEG